MKLVWKRLAFVMCAVMTFMSVMISPISVDAKEGQETAEISSHLINYITLGESEQTKSDVQEITVGIGNGTEKITAATLYYENSTLHKSYNIAADAFSEEAVAFHIRYTDKQKGIYQLTKIVYSIGEHDYTQWMSKMGMNIKWGVEKKYESSPDDVIDDKDVEEFNESELQQATLNVEDELEQSVEQGEIESDQQKISGDAILDDEQLSMDMNDGYDVNEAMDSGTVAMALEGNCARSVMENVTVVIDPGHGGKDSGANANGLHEKDLNLAVAQACKTELETYDNVNVYITRSGDEYLTLDERTSYAQSVGATAFVSIHMNSASSSSANGCEIYYPNQSYNVAISEQGKGLANDILANIVTLGMGNRGLKIRNATDGGKYPDGSICDYYSVIRESKNKGFPGIIVEHGFITGSQDAPRLADANFLHSLGVADATGIAQYFGLSKKGFTLNNIKGAFDASYYKKQYADVATLTDQQALNHYLNCGVYEGRQGSPCFNYQYYKQHCSDLASSFGNDAKLYIKHFLEHGMDEGRQASENFNVYSYRNQYEDLRKGYKNNLRAYYLHYCEHGYDEGRNGVGYENIETNDVGTTIYNGVDYSAVYNFSYYINHYPDMKSAFSKNDEAALWHFVNYGMNEGRQASENFNVYSYKNQYADLRKGYGNNLRQYYLHYCNYGRNEGRNGRGYENTVVGAETIYNGVDYSAVYDFNDYINTYSDMKSAYSQDDNAALWHFVNYGMNEGRQGKKTFDVYSYRNQYSDLRGAYGNNLKYYYLHYINYGRREGRQTTGCTTLQNPVTVYNGVDYSSVYNFYSYIGRYSDMKKNFSNDDQGALWHFVNHGMSEGRQANDKFNVYVYKDKYEDLRNAWGNNLALYYEHYLKHGQAEGRTGI